MSCRLAIVSSHPIQYNAPAFAALSKDPDLDVHVFYSWNGPTGSPDPEFGHAVSWDIPLLEGYEYTFVPNRSANPGTHHFRGLDNPEMITEISAWNPDVLLVYGWSFLTHLRVMHNFKTRLPLLFRGDSTLLGERSQMVRLARRTFLRWVFSHVDTALYVGKRNREYYVEMGLSGEQLRWAPHAVDNVRFEMSADRDERRAREWRNSLGIGGEDVVFLFAGKLIARKDPWTLLRAFLRMERGQTSRRAHLIFAGEGDLRPQLERESRGRNDVHFVGFQNQSAMSTVYRLGNVLMLPSLIDTWGLAVNEAMACSRPAIVSDLVGCGPDLIRDGETGAVFKHGDDAALSRLLESVRDSRESWDQMGVAAKKLIAMWSIPEYARVVREVALSR